jgi:hypothetical protein
MKTLTRLMLMSILSASCVALASADMPGQHPTYVHGLSDLRAARAHLDYHAANEKRDAEEDHAIRLIDDAIDAAKRAAVADGREVKDSFPPDVRLERTDRFRQAQQLLDNARRNIAAKEDNPRARDLQAQAVARIDEARRIVDKLMDSYRDHR